PGIFGGRSPCDGTTDRGRDFRERSALDPRGGAMTRILLASGLDPYALFAASRDDHPHAFILESLTGPARLAEHTFVGFDPEIIISYPSGVLRSNGETVKTRRTLGALRSILEMYETQGVPGRLIDALVGYDPSH